MKTIDARGKACPEPVILTKACVDQGEKEVEVLLDNPVSASNVRRFLENKGFSVQLKDDDGMLTILAGPKNEQIKVAAVPSKKQGQEPPRQTRPGASTEPQEQAESARPFSDFPTEKETFSVLVTCQNIGQSDQQLGDVLMKSFLGTLSQLDDAPLAVALMNEGVKLALYDSSSCDHLKNLEKKGTLILVCGTCVSHFHIAEQVGVGTISNMFEIVETLNKAKKIITL
ncbi:MAG: sulfurtransferase-like selenium metabolism protein YedF [Synergistaceae bacterium]|jgi:selenium metabolism protein YedF|nr:sulfurtransferase-like selenium metabolism protein YedF [Synergistaceae bacterium]